MLGGRNENEIRPPQLPPLREIQVQCFPLFSILKALGNPHIDYFSLDIEGAEMVVLKTIPWHKVNMTLLSIEVNHAGDIFPGTRKDINEFMNKKGYKFAKQTAKAYDDFFYNEENNRWKKSKKKTEL